MNRYAITHGEVLSVLRSFKDNSFDALICDPPYGFRFMGKAWDYDVPSVEIWRECLRVLKPGAPLLSYGGSRTYHRIAIGIEDAGFELRDCLMWLYGKGFPKSQNIALALDKAAGATRPIVGTRKLTGNAALSTKEKGGTYGVQVGSVPTKIVDVTGPATEESALWEGFGTALKPAFEPVALARKPLIGTMVENVRAFGVGGLAIDACRIDWQGKASGWSKSGSKSSANVAMSGANYDRDAKPDAEGRWPANLLLDEDAAAYLDELVGVQPSRFFYCSKVSTKEREAGCEHLPLRSAGEVTDREDGSVGLDNPRAGAGRGGGARNVHPTLKPIALNTWLARLIQPPTSGVLLVPFAGAGSEMIGALKAGWSCVFGIEGEAEYVEIARARLRHWCGNEAQEEVA